MKKNWYFAVDNYSPEMENIIEQLQYCLSSFKDLPTFEAFTKQASHLIYDEIHKCNDTNDFIEKYFVIPEDKMSKTVEEVLKSKKENIPMPEYEIKEKKTRKVRNPKTGRDIYFGGDLFHKLVETGWLDKDGKPLKNHTVKKIKNPKTGKPITVGVKVYKKMIDDGWIDKEGKILKVMNPKTDTPISIEDPEFKKLVKEGIFNNDGTIKDIKKRNQIP